MGMEDEAGGRSRGEGANNNALDPWGNQNGLASRNQPPSVFDSNNGRRRSTEMGSTSDTVNSKQSYGIPNESNSNANAAGVSHGDRNTYYNMGMDKNPLALHSEVAGQVTEFSALEDSAPAPTMGASSNQPDDRYHEPPVTAFGPSRPMSYDIHNPFGLPGMGKPIRAVEIDRSLDYDESNPFGLPGMEAPQRSQ